MRTWMLHLQPYLIPLQHPMLPLISYLGLTWRNLQIWVSLIKIYSIPTRKISLLYLIHNYVLRFVFSFFLWLCYLCFPSCLPLLLFFFSLSWIISIFTVKSSLHHLISMSSVLMCLNVWICLGWPVPPIVLRNRQRERYINPIWEVMFMKTYIHTPNLEVYICFINNLFLLYL